jgi:hypothetical protein
MFLVEVCVTTDIEKNLAFKSPKWREFRLEM